MIDAMEVENGKNPQLGTTSFAPRNKLMLAMTMVLLRFGVLITTGAAAIIMGVNKQIRILAMGILGTASINKTIVANFEQTPAFIYFVIANATASGYNLSVLILNSFFKCKEFGRSVLVIDTVVLALVATAVAAAATIVDIEENGNFYNRWFPICNLFGSFCKQGEAAVVASLVGTLFLLILCTLSTIVKQEGDDSLSLLVTCAADVSRV